MRLPPTVGGALRLAREKVGGGLEPPCPARRVRSVSRPRRTTSPMRARTRRAPVPSTVLVPRLVAARCLSLLAGTLWLRRCRASRLLHLVNAPWSRASCAVAVPESCAVWLRVCGELPSPVRGPPVSVPGLVSTAGASSSLSVLLPATQQTIEHTALAEGRAPPSCMYGAPPYLSVSARPPVSLPASSADAPSASTREERCAQLPAPRPPPFPRRITRIPP